jgi:hypothetical protein|tara:strand:+ start:2124 stop:2273 length:150 start_codon:yes stop_codon:yes gene_type:complete
MKLEEWCNLREAMSNLDNVIGDCSIEVKEAIDEVWDLVDEIGIKILKQD